MTRILKWALVLFLALSFISHSKAQTVDPITGSTLNSTGNVLNLGGGLPWTGTVTGQAGGTSGGPTPAYNPSTGNIIFSFSTKTVSQSIAINQALANAGTGIQLSGYNYQWQIQNDINTGGSNRGTLTGNVSLTGSGGNVLESFNYDYNQNLPSFTVFKGTQLFENRYSLAAVSDLTVSFTGKDKTFWAGYYGPRVHVDSFSLLYTAKPVSVVTDPCVADPLSSPSCSGYALAYIKNSLLGSTVSNASATSYVPTNTNTYTSPASTQTSFDTTNPTAQQQSQQPVQQQTQQVSVTQQQSPAQDLNQNPVVAQDNPAQPSPQQAGPAATTPQPAGGPPQTTTATAPQSSSGPQQAGPTKADGTKMTPGAALSVARAAQEKDKATQQMAVQNAARIVESSTQQSQATVAAAIASLNDMSANSAQSAAQFSSQSTQASIQSFVQPNQPQQAMQSSNTQSSQSNKGLQQSQQPVEIQQASTQSFASIVQIQQPTYTSTQQDTQSAMVNITKPPVILSQETTTQTVGGTGLVAKVNPIGFNLYSLNNNTQSTPATAPTIQLRTETKSTEVEVPTIQIASFGGSKAGNPLSDLMQQRFEMMQENIQQQTSSVNKNVQPNELASGVDIASMAVQPKGFEAYSFVIRDAAFYEPKEVYKGQTVIDNARALRQMSSDSLHKQMIDMQYK